LARPGGPRSLWLCKGGFECDNLPNSEGAPESRVSVDWYWVPPPYFAKAGRDETDVVGVVVVGNNAG
jgi:hypothetical protein